jgi:hypothetical protein
VCQELERGIRQERKNGMRGKESRIGVTWGSDSYNEIGLQSRSPWQCVANWNRNWCRGRNGVKGRAKEVKAGSLRKAEEEAGAVSGK